MIQEYKWVDNGNFLQGRGFFNFESLNDGYVQNAGATIRFTDFSMKIKNNVAVSEPPSISLLIFALLPLAMKKKWQTEGFKINLTGTRPNPPL